MIRYTGTPDYPHDGSERVGVLLVNHGSPDGPTPQQVRPYLRRFLSDPRLIELPRLLWFLVLNGIILVTRPRRSARAYSSIWTEDGSPMDVYSEALRAALDARLTERFGDRIRVALGMTYGRPSIEAALNELRDAGAMRIAVLPLYPQYSATTVGSVFDKVTQTLQRWRWVPELRFVTDYCDHPLYIEALAGSLRDHWRENGRNSRLLFSFHGIPQKYADKGDPYYCYCHKTARLVAAKLGLDDAQWAMSFQSRLGPNQWLGPYTEDVLDEWRAQGHADVDVICPGFAVDCLETLEEIADGLRERQQSLGGELAYIPCLNAGSEHVAALEAVVNEQLGGWDKTLRSVSAVPPAGRTVESETGKAAIP